MEKKKKSDTRLSYSSATLLSNCEQRYWHYKVNGTERDSDCEDSTEAFDLGKTFHEVLEFSNHLDVDIPKQIDKACEAYGTEDKKPLVTAMVRKYLKLNELSGLIAVKCELAISDPKTIGYIDVIMEDQQGIWWIVDLKTSGRWSSSILSRLAMDYQLNLYASYYKGIGSVLGLDPKKFGGCRYRVTTKSTIARKKGEEFEPYVKRLMSSVKSFDIIIPKSELHIKEVSNLHIELYNRSMQLRLGEVPRQNLSYCESYFKPCPYWSKCHGDLASKTKDKVTLYDEYLYNEENEAINDL